MFNNKSDSGLSILGHNNTWFYEQDASDGIPLTTALHSASSASRSSSPEPRLGFAHRVESGILDSKYPSFHITSNTTISELISAITSDAPLPSAELLLAGSRNHLSVPELNRLSLAQLRQLHPAALNNLTSDEIAGRVRIKKNNLSIMATRVRAPVLTCFPEFTVGKLAPIIAHFIPETEVIKEGLSANVLNNLSNEAIGKIKEEVLNNLSTAELGKLSLRVIAFLNPATFEKIDVQVFRNCQQPLLSNYTLRCKNIDSVRSRLQADALNLVSKEGIGTLSEHLLNSLPPGVLQALNPEVLNNLSNATISKLHPRVLAHFHSRNYKHLSDRFLMHFSDPIVQEISKRKSLANLSSDEKNQLDAWRINNFTEAYLINLEASFFNNLPDAVLRLLDARVLNLIPDRTLRKFHELTYNVFSMHQFILNNLSDNVFSQLNDRVLRILSVDLLLSLEVRVMNRLPDDVLRSNTASILSCKPDAQLRQLDARVLNHLSDHELNDLNGDILNKLSDDALSQLKAHVLNKLSDHGLSQLNIRVFKRLSNVALSELEGRVMNELTDDVLVQLEASVLNAMKPAMLRRSPLHARVLNLLSKDELRKLKDHVLDWNNISDKSCKDISENVREAMGFCAYSQVQAMIDGNKFEQAPVVQNQSISSASAITSPDSEVLSLDDDEIRAPVVLI